MRDFLILLKIQLNVTYGFSAMRYAAKSSKRKLIQGILLGLLMIFGIGSISAVFTGIMYGVYMGGQAVGHPEIVLSVSFLATQMMVFFFGIFYVMGAFYFANDMEILLPLPIKPFHILGSKLAIVTINEYLTVVPVFLPALLIYGIGTSQDFFYYIKALLILICSPFLPLILCSLFNVILMSFANPKKSKDVIAVIGGFFAIFLGLGWNFVIQKFSKNMDGGKYEEYIANNSDLLDKVGNGYPPVVWVTKALSGSGTSSILNLSLFIFTALILTVILIFMVNKVFIKSIVSGAEVSRRSKRISREDLSQKYIKHSSEFAAIFRREWKMFFRTPMYLLNGITGIIMTPIILIMPVFTQWNEISPLLDQVKEDATIRNFVVLGVAGFLILISNMNIISNTAISREGKMFWISRMIPVSPRVQIKAKVLFCTVIQFAGILLGIGVTVFIFAFNLFDIACLLALTLLATLFLIIVNMQVDVIRPKLNWNNEQEAVKQNINSFFGIMITLAFLAINVVIVLLMNFVNVPFMAIVLILSVFYIIMIVAFRELLYVSAESMYRKIET